MAAFQKGYPARRAYAIATLCCDRRYPRKPIPANPMINIAHVEGSGTAEMVKVPLNGAPLAQRKESKQGKPFGVK